MSIRVPFNALTPGEDAAAVRAAIDRVIASGWFVLGPEVEAFEAEFAAASRVPHAVGVGTGTDAITLILRALDIGPGDEVITPPLSAAYSALAVMMAGARPVFADIDPERLTMDPRAAAAAITPRTKALLPVHLYGQAADLRPLEALASKHRLALVEDAAQSHLGTADGRPIGTIGIAAATSFYPTKNLGALGDGGAVLTRDAALAARVKRLRNGGQTSRYHHEEPGANSRLDEMQAAILRARLHVSPAMDRAAPRDCREVPRRAVSVRVAGAARVRRRPRVSPVSGPHRTSRRLPGPDAGTGCGNADSLPRPHPAAAGAQIHQPGHVRGRRPGVLASGVVADVSGAFRRGGLGRGQRGRGVQALSSDQNRGRHPGRLKPYTG